MGEIYAFDTEILQMIDFKAANPQVTMAPNASLGIWEYGTVFVYIAPGRFFVADQEKIYHLADFDS